MSKDSTAIETSALTIVDTDGRARIVLTTDGGQPSLRLMRIDGSQAASLKLDAVGRPALVFDNLSPALPTVSLEIDDMGAHVKFDRMGGATSYVFLNNAGGSGIVLCDAVGERRFSATVSADGDTTVHPVVPHDAP